MLVVPRSAEFAPQMRNRSQADRRCTPTEAHSVPLWSAATKVPNTSRVHFRALNALSSRGSPRVTHKRIPEVAVAKYRADSGRVDRDQPGQGYPGEKKGLHSCGSA